MPDILIEVTVQQSPDKVYKALTEQDGIASWWTTGAKVQPQVGTISEFPFYDGQILMKMEVAELEPQHVEWKALSGVPDWPGTRVTWDLSPAEQGTRVQFGHRDFASTDGSLPFSTYNWAWYMVSLKEYVETGTGRPHTGAANT